MRHNVMWLDFAVDVLSGICIGIGFGLKHLVNSPVSDFVCRSLVCLDDPYGHRWSLAP